MLVDTHTHLSSLRKYERGLRMRSQHALGLAVWCQRISFLWLSQVSQSMDSGCEAQTLNSNRPLALLCCSGQVFLPP